METPKTGTLPISDLFVVIATCSYPPTKRKTKAKEDMPEEKDMQKENPTEGELRQEIFHQAVRVASDHSNGRKPDLDALVKAIDNFFYHTHDKHYAPIG